jgi:ATP-dependent RNA helicase DDX47/RRP3
LLFRPTSYFALILAPARELVVQIADHLKALGARIGLKVAVIIGSMDVKSQVKALTAGPHIVVGTPGKILYHMQNTKAFAYSNIKHLVMD